MFNRLLYFGSILKQTQVTRRNSYSDKDMFEAEMMGQADEEDDVTGKVVGAIAIGLGKTVGIRVCLLRHTESRTIARGSITALTRQDSSEGAESSGEDEVSHVHTTIAGTLEGLV